MSLVFPAKEAPRKIHPQEIHLSKFTFQNSNQKSGQKIHIAPLQGLLTDFSVEKKVFGEKAGGNSVNEGFGKNLYRKGNSVKRFGPFTEPPDSEN